MTRRMWHVFVGGGLLTSPHLWAQDAKAILDQVSETYRTLSSYLFEGKTVSATTIKNKTAEREVGFVVAFQSPDKFRLELQYPEAGNWLRVSDGAFLLEERTISKESQRNPVDSFTIRALNSSPIANFEHLATTAQNAKVVRSEPVSVDGRQIDCDVLEFESHRRELQHGEKAGPSLVWVAKDSHLVLREEIRTSAVIQDEASESRRVTTISRFQIGDGFTPGELFSTAGSKFDKKKKRK